MYYPVHLVANDHMPANLKDLVSTFLGAFLPKKNNTLSGSIDIRSHKEYIFATGWSEEVSMTPDLHDLMKIIYQNDKIHHWFHV